MKRAVTLFVCVALFLLTAIADAQSTDQSPLRAEPGYRFTLTEFEGMGNSGTWTFLGAKGSGKWKTGEDAVLEVESLKDGRIVIQRTDITGSKAGLHATYTGTVRDGRLGGEVESHYQSHDETGNWYAMSAGSAAAPEGPPSVMHWCAQHCNTIGGLENGGPSEKPHYGSVSAGSIWVVDKFTPESVIINRTDYGLYPGIAVMTGRLSPDGNSIVDGVITWTYHPCCGLGSMPFQAAWGPAINTVPGSDAEKAARGPQSSPITLTDVINAGPKIEAWLGIIQKTLDIGQKVFGANK